MVEFGWWMLILYHEKILFSLLILISALAVDAKNIDGISYSLNSTDKKAQVKGFAEGVSKSKLVIPDKVTSGGVTYKVTSIAKEALAIHGSWCLTVRLRHTALHPVGDSSLI